MKKICFAEKLTLALAIMLLAFSAFAQESLKITSGDIDLKVGETAQLTAEYLDSDSVLQEVTINWNVVPDSLGTIDGTGIFTAEKPGEGYVFAQYESLVDSVEVEVEAVEEEDDDEEMEEDDDEERNWGTLTILNGPIELDPGQTIQLQAEYADTSGTVQDVKINWHSDPGYLGKADKSYVFTAKHPGEGMLYAKYRSLIDSVEVKINGTKKDDEDDDDDYEPDYPKVKVIPGMIKVAAGDSVELVAFYVNEEDEKVDTTFSWAVLPAELGAFPDSTKNMFYAGNEPGDGYIVAWLGDLADTVKLRVIEPKTKHNKGNNSRRITIMPGDTVVNMGDLAFLQYSADYKTNGNKHEDEELEWSMSGDSIGTIDETGLVTLSGETGLALITAKYSNFSAYVELLVVDPDADTEVNTIKIHRVLPDGHELPAKVFNEGESYKIGGLPFPLNILNGGMLHFPFGCIEEDIVIYMFIPEEYAESDEESGEVQFSEEIINGVKFSVKPVDSLEIEEPFYFNIPINLAMVFKHELLDSLGVAPEELDVFFADNTGFVSEGTENVTVDTVKNKIYAAIEHFSTIVVKQKSASTFINDVELDEENNMIIYPNPFSNSTKISFDISKRTDVQLEIYNMYGQKLKTLVHETREKGTHTIEWNGATEDNQLVTPGIYFCRMVLDGKQTAVKRLIINR